MCSSDQKEIYIGDDNPLTLEVTAENGGEGAYEADLIVTLPSQADFIGVVRNSEVSSDMIKCTVLPTVTLCKETTNVVLKRLF